MNTLLKITLSLLLLAIGATYGHAAKKDDINLIVTSDGATKDEAIKNALRTAVEQTYGVFVSANTDIFNDELVKDAIATVSSGNIKNFKEIATTNDNGHYSVTLDVTVRKGKLLSYAKSKGAECEIDGASISADMELQELYKSNEEKLFQNLLTELSQLFQNGYDYKLEVNKAQNPYSGYVGSHYGNYNPNENPGDNVCFECLIYAKLNEQGEAAWNRLLDALNTVGKSYNPFKFRLFPSMKDPLQDEEFPAIVRIGEGTFGYNQTMYKVRSAQTAQMVMTFIKEIPACIKNISLDINGNVIDISRELVPFELQGWDSLKKSGPYNKKKGSNCGQFRYSLSVPIESLKGIKNIKIESNYNLHD